MNANAVSVFISYSRRDYYFAESLAFHLSSCSLQPWLDTKDLTPGAQWPQQLNAAIDECDAFLLVASPSALASEYVTTEWQRARAAGKRIVLLGWYRRVELPQALQDCEWVDFRGRFGSALRRLVIALASGNACPLAGPRPGNGPCLPPAVVGVLLALVTPIMGYCLTVATDSSQFEFEDLEDYFLMPIFAFAITWFLCFGLVWRRMSMTRMIVCLALVALPPLLAALNVASEGARGLAEMPPPVAKVVLQYLPLVWALGTLPLLTICVLWWRRPEDLLRWMPTGKAWKRFRTKLVEQLRPPVVNAEAVLASLGSYRLLHDQGDEPLAEHLRGELSRLGAREAETADLSARLVVLVTNRSTLGWLERNVRPHAARGLLVLIGSAFRLDSAADWLWRNHWIDLRTWKLRPKIAPGLPALPETTTALRMPRAVSRTHDLLCAFAATQFAGFNAGPSSPPSNTEGLGVAAFFALVVLLLLFWDKRGLARFGMKRHILVAFVFLSLVLVAELVLDRQSLWSEEEEDSITDYAFTISLLLTCWTARQIALRGDYYTRLSRLTAAAVASGVVVSLFNALRSDAPRDAVLFMWLTFLVSLWLTLKIGRSWSRISFWLPRQLSANPTRMQRLTPEAGWRTFIAVIGFVALWAALEGELVADGTESAATSTMSSISAATAEAKLC